MIETGFTWENAVIAWAIKKKLKITFLTIADKDKAVYHLFDLKK
jgi:hypothetical protein